MATEMLDAAVADYVGIDRGAYRCPDILEQEGPMTAGQLAERARLSRGAMTALLDRLEERGLARRTREPRETYAAISVSSLSARTRSPKYRGLDPTLSAGP